MKAQKFFWLFLTLLTALRLKVADGFGLTVDEAHYVLYGKILDWSYFDHPPLVGWVHALFRHLPIDSTLQARLAAIIISVLTSLLLFDYLTKKGTTEKNALLAVIVLNLTPMFNAVSVALLPDTLLMPLSILIISTTEKIIKHSNLKNWVLLGLWLGLAGLSKYTAGLYIISLILIFIYSNKLKELLTPRLWAGVLIALLLISPVLYWNVKNNWISLLYQSEHVFAFDSSLLKNLSGSFFIQLFSWGIGPFLISILVFLKMLSEIKQKVENVINLVFLSVFFIFFFYIALSTPLLPHWMLIYFTMMIPLSIAHLLEERKFLKIISFGSALSALMTLALLFELAFKVFPASSTAKAYEGILGWDKIMTVANEKLKSIKNSKKALAVMNWTLGSRAMYYNNNNEVSVFVIDQRFDQFDIWTPQSSIGFDLIAIIEAEKKTEHLAHLNCAQITLVGENTTLIKNVPVNHFLYYHCANFSGYQ